MTEKRFIYKMKNGSCIIIDTKKNVLIRDMYRACDFLNMLHEENEELKSKNRGLQSELQIFKEDVTHSNLQINKLTDENEQLKSENRLLKGRMQEYEEQIGDVE